MSTLTDSFPHVIAETVRRSATETFGGMWGEEPDCRPGVAPSGNGVIGTISFVGDLTWALSILVPEATAPALAQKFAGFEIPFDSPDMGDVIGELANVLGGDVGARLDGTSAKGQMSLPAVARGSDVDALLPEGKPEERLVFDWSFGSFGLRLAATRPGDARLPGT